MDEYPSVSTKAATPEKAGILRISRPDIAAQVASLAASHTPLPDQERAAVLALSYGASTKKALEVAEKSVLTPEFCDEFCTQVATQTGLVPAQAPRSWADIVFEKDGVPMASSRMVAEVFEKRHDNVLRAIDVLRTEMADVGSSELSGLFTEGATYNDKARKDVRFFLMTRDGFSLLAMGFTGKRALEFKLGFIKAFNDMETAFADRLAAEHRERLARTTQLMIDAEKQRDAIAAQAEGARKVAKAAELPKRPERSVSVTYQSLDIQSEEALSSNKLPSP